MSTITGQKAVAINGTIKLDKASQTQTFSHSHKSTKVAQISIQAVSDIEFLKTRALNSFVSAGFISILKVWPPPDQLDM